MNPGNGVQIMKATSKVVRIVLGAIALGTVAVQGAQFFRIVGPAATKITALSVDGYLTWTNAPTNATFIVQTARSLLNSTGWVDYIQVPVTNALAVERIYDPNPPSGMVFIPAGSFTMGNCMDPNEGTMGELPLHTVNVSALYMDRYLVTYQLWSDVYAWATSHGYSFDNAVAGKAANHPVQTVDWYDCVKWCNARSEKEGKVPAYYTDAGLTVRYRRGQVAPYVNWARGYRLPTEAEWEKAARGGVSGQRFPWGNTISWNQANYSAYPSGYNYDVNPTAGYHPVFNDGVYPYIYTSPVGYFGANGYGLYDMGGNVWQWCWDWWDYYSSGAQTDPRGASGGEVRVLRGGSWNVRAIYCRAASRYGNPPSRYSDNGFRCALPPG
jgi:formylglycine-generating enzyme